MLDPWCKSLSGQNEKTLLLYRALQTQPSHIFLVFFAVLTCSPHSQGRAEMKARSSCSFQESATSFHPLLPCFCLLLSLCFHMHWQTVHGSRWFLNTHFCWPSWLWFLLCYSARLYFRVRKAIYIYPSVLLRCVLPLTCAEPTAHIRTAMRPQDMYKLQLASSSINFVFSKISIRLWNSGFVPLLSELQVLCFLRAPAKNVN